MLPLSVLIIIIMIVITAETSMICASPYQAISMNGMDSTEQIKRMCHRTAYMHISIYTYIYIYAHVHMSGGVYKGAFFAVVKGFVLDYVLVCLLVSLLNSACST